MLKSKGADHTSILTEKNANGRIKQFQHLKAKDHKRRVTVAGG